MENLATVVAAVVKSLPTKPSNDSLSVLPQPPEADRARAIYRIIAEVEMVKMINPPATDQQREALMRLLSATGRPIEEIARMGRSVVTKPTFGNIAFEHWELEDDRPRLNRVPEKEPDRYCMECNCNHKWDEICPILLNDPLALK